MQRQVPLLMASHIVESSQKVIHGTLSLSAFNGWAGNARVASS